MLNPVQCPFGKALFCSAYFWLNRLKDSNILLTALTWSLILLTDDLLLAIWFRRRLLLERMWGCFLTWLRLRGLTPDEGFLACSLWTHERSYHIVDATFTTKCQWNKRLLSPIALDLTFYIYVLTSRFHNQYWNYGKQLQAEADSNNDAERRIIR